MEQQRFEFLKERAKEMAKRTGACKEGFKRLIESTNFGEFCSVMQQYWTDILQMLKKKHFRYYL
jgi:23S rRNA A2030 N6-methylase RlmJ